MAADVVYEVKVKHKIFITHEEVESPLTGKTRLKEIIHRRGDVIEVTEADHTRGQALGAFYKDVETDAEDNPVNEKSVEELQLWLEEEKPSAATVIDAVGDNPELARRVLEAEENATGGDPRQNLVKGLSAVIEHHTQ